VSHVRGARILVVAPLVLAALAATAQAPAPSPRTSTAEDPPDEPLPEGEDAAEPAAEPQPPATLAPVVAPSAAPVVEPRPVPAPPRVPAVPPTPVPPPAPARGPVLVLIHPASATERARALALGDAAAVELAAGQGGVAVTLEALLDPGREGRLLTRRSQALAVARQAAEALEALDLEEAHALGEEAVLALAALEALDPETEAALQTSLLGLAVAALYDSDVLRADGAFVALAAWLTAAGRGAPLLAEVRRYPSKVISRFESTRAELEARPTGRIQVTSRPAGAAVRVDGVERGIAPLEVGGLAEGLHVVALGGPGFVSTGALVDVVADEVVPVDRPLEPEPLAEALRSAPAAGAVDAAIAWARDLGVGALFLGGASALGVVRGQWIDVTAGRAEVDVEVLASGDVAAGARALAAEVDRALVARAALAVEPPPADEGPPLTSRWWFWAGVGGVVVAAAAGAAVALASGDGGPPRGTAIFGF
jgi:hypothetical protein